MFVGPSKKRGMVFEDASFSPSRLKHSIISSLIFWVGIMPDVDTSFVKRLSHLYMSTTSS